MELSIKSPIDLQKIEGWTIQKVELLPGADAGFRIEITHPVAACPVNLIIMSGVQFGRSGNIVLCNGTLIFKTEDIK